MKQKGKRLLFVVLGIFLAMVLVPAAWYGARRLEGDPPRVELDGSLECLGAASVVSGLVEDPGNGLSSLRIALTMPGNKEVELYSKDFPAKGFLRAGKVREERFQAAVEPAKLDIPDGQALLRITARDRSLRGWLKGNLAYVEMPVTIDTAPPSLSVLTTAHYLNQGGAGLVAYRVSEKGAVHGVRVGDHFFPGYAGGFKDPDVCMAFFAVAHDQGVDTHIVLEAVDKAGNKGSGAFNYRINKKMFRDDSLGISDRFIDTVLPQIKTDGRLDPALPPLDRFLFINREQRRQDYQKATSMSQKSEPVMRWSGAFGRLPNAAPRAQFADRRQYVYNGAVVDHQVHLGVDLASLAQSPAPASNGGKVVFMGDMGIYGLTVFLDHGFGLLSQYSHLSRIDVTPGQVVEKDHVLGLTGATGLAGGDHLHFGIMVGDTFVNPVEWWDASWIQNNVASKLDMVAGRFP